MRLLLDTHIFLWWDSDPTKLSSNVISALTDPVNTLFVSVVSIWEMQIKKDIGKLSLRIALADMLIEQETKNQIKVLPIEAKHIFGLETMPQHHKDPFDRLIIAQAIVEDLTVISNDGIFSSYEIKLLS
jgi:PIN domain nuclease of toxin-antitoxin system